MVELEHRQPEPEELRTYRRKHPGSGWDDPAFASVRPLVRQQLHREQEGLCVYCEGYLDEQDGHIEHIKTRSAHPRLMFVYDNLAHSCNDPNHCGHHRKSQALPIEPRLGCNRFFVLMALDGKLIPALGLTEEEQQQASATLTILGLNTPALARQRKNYTDIICALADTADIAEFVASAPFRWSLQGF